MSENSNNISDELLSRCIKKDRNAQYLLYEKYSKKIFGVCLRYAKTILMPKTYYRKDLLRYLNISRTIVEKDHLMAGLEEL